MVDFFITDGEIALFAVLGTIVGVVIGGLITTWSQVRATRDSHKAQLELVRSQHDSEELARLSEKAGTATVAFMNVLLHFPSLPHMIVRSWLADNESFLADLQEWRDDFTNAAAPLLVYGSEPLKARLLVDVNKVHDGTEYIKWELSSLIHRAENDPKFSVVFKFVQSGDNSTLEGAVKRYREMREMQNELIKLIRAIFPMQSSQYS